MLAASSSTPYDCRPHIARKSRGCEDGTLYDPLSSSERLDVLRTPVISYTCCALSSPNVTFVMASSQANIKPSWLPSDLTYVLTALRENPVAAVTEVLKTTRNFVRGSLLIATRGTGLFCGSGMISNNSVGF